MSSVVLRVVEESSFDSRDVAIRRAGDITLYVKRSNGYVLYINPAHAPLYVFTRSRESFVARKATPQVAEYERAARLCFEYGEVWLTNSPYVIANVETVFPGVPMAGIERSQHQIGTVGWNVVNSLSILGHNDLTVILGGYILDNEPTFDDNSNGRVLASIAVYKVFENGDWVYKTCVKDESRIDFLPVMKCFKMLDASKRNKSPIHRFRQNFHFGSA
ncbi:minor CP [Ampelovirus sp.]|nr:minor CP [Ampelovirus sp.]